MAFNSLPAFMGSRVLEDGDDMAEPLSRQPPLISVWVLAAELPLDKATLSAAQMKVCGNIEW